MIFPKVYLMEFSYFIIHMQSNLLIQNFLKILMLPMYF